MARISNTAFIKAINGGIVNPQLSKDMKKAMNLEFGIFKIEKANNYII